MKKLFIPMALIGLVGCADTKYYTDPQAAQESITCNTDKFNGQTTCYMPNIMTCKDGNPPKSSLAGCGVPATSMMLKTVYDDKVAVFGLNGYVAASNWIFPYKVTDDAGKDMKIGNTDSRAGSLTKEYLSLELDRKYISDHTQTGIAMKVYGKRNDAIITLPAAYVQGFDSFLKSKGL